jgi:hypothetical protein
MSNKRPVEMNEGPAAFGHFRDAMKSILSVSKKDLPTKAKGKSKIKPKKSALLPPTS